MNGAPFATGYESQYMPEGPSIVILKELVQPFKGKKVLVANGNSSMDIAGLVNKKLVDFKSWGKHFLICFSHTTVRIHFLMFGSYSINEQTKPDKSLRLALHFNNGAIYFTPAPLKNWMKNRMMYTIGAAML